MSDRSALPPGLPPRFLAREAAAEYLGVSVNVFEAEVAAGLWPAPIRRGAKGGRTTWDRLALDAAADRLSGLAPGPAAGHPPGPNPWDAP